MKRLRKRSRKRSAASSTADRRLKQAVFYLDESIYSLVLRDRLRMLGANVEHAGVAFPFGSTDEIWLEGCGAKRWIVLSRDKQIRHRRLEIETLRAAGVAAFVFTGGEATAQETADIIAALIRKFVNITISEPRPFLYTFGMSGSLRKIRL